MIGTKAFGTFCLTLALATNAPAVRAQGEGNAAAEALFQEGRALFEQGKFDEGCPKLAESQRLDLVTPLETRRRAPGQRRTHRCRHRVLHAVALGRAEACIGETLAAVEAAEAAEHAEDPVVRATLSRIAKDEHRHAELGWKFVAWALERTAPDDRSRIVRSLYTVVDRAASASHAPRVSAPVDATLLRALAARSPVADTPVRPTETNTTRIDER